MRPTPWSTRLLLSGLALACLGASPGADGRPDGLPHELISLRDGRRLGGHYDPLTAWLWLDGPYRACLRLYREDIVRRQPLTEQEAATSSPAPRPPALRLREQQLAELLRRLRESDEAVRALAQGLDARLRALEDEVRALRADNLDLRRRLDGMPVPPAPAQAPGEDDVPTDPDDATGAQPGVAPAADDRLALR